jgi:protein gp37
MAENTSIEWTDHTFNPWWGCTKVSPGCKHCYAETMARRFGGDIWGPGRSRRTFGDEHWQQPLRWERRAVASGRRLRVFCASMADVFEAGAPASQRERLWHTIEATPHLDWQILTKRPEAITDHLPREWIASPRANVWLGTSVEDQTRASRAETLASVPAKVRFLSVEPLIGPVPELPLAGIDWVIVGGESGPRSRPMDSSWVLDIYAQCRAAHVPFFFKQWGGRDKKAAGRKLRGRTHDAMPRVSAVAAG